MTNGYSTLMLIMNFAGLWLLEPEVETSLFEGSGNNHLAVSKTCWLMVLFWINNL